MRKNRRGQATIEFIVSYATLVLPVTMMIIFTAQLLWVWHSMTDWTALGARYASTHCWQGDGGNVRTWMQQNVPLTADRDQFQSGPAEIEVAYFKRDPDSGSLADFSCDSGECSRNCIPDTVRIRVTGYEYRGVFTYLGLPPLAMPDFTTSVAIESAGCNPDSEECLP